MQIEKGYIYHIYNQGNNRQKIFFERENYLFFLKKMKTHLLPFCDILAYCLMPNHFHWMVLVNELELSRSELNKLSRSATSSFRASQGLTQSQTLTEKRQSFNDSIGVMLRSYTRAINKQRSTTGALFRKATKAECLNNTNGVSPSFFTVNRVSPSFFTVNGVTQINIQYPEKQYPQICFNYIHQNPVNANLVKKDVDWEFSSALDYAGLRDEKLVNKEIALKYIQNKVGVRL